MKKYYAYIPTKEGKEPLGTRNRFKFQLKSDDNYAIKKARKQLGSRFRLFSYTNFYNDTTFILITDTTL